MCSAITVFGGTQRGTHCSCPTFSLTRLSARASAEPATRGRTYAGLRSKKSEKSPEPTSRAPPPVDHIDRRRSRRALKSSRSEEQTSELQSLMRKQYAIYC